MDKLRSENFVKELSRALQDFYTTLCKLPYIDTNALKVPPPEGWPTIIDDKLRKHGKSEKAINLLRRLPYLEKTSDWHDTWVVYYETHTVDYTSSQAEDQCVDDDFCPLPANAVFLATRQRLYGYDWILDVDAETITTYNLMGSCQVDRASHRDERGHATKDAWMHYETWPAVTFFQRMTRCYKRNFYMLVPVINSSELAGFVQLSHKRDDIQDAGDSTDDDWDVDESNESDDLNEGDSDDDEMFEDAQEDSEHLGEELSDLQADRARHGEIQALNTENNAEDNIDCPVYEIPNSPEPDRNGHEHIYQKFAEDCLKAHQKYGWPDNFNKDACKVVLSRLWKRHLDDLTRPGDNPDDNDNRLRTKANEEDPWDMDINNLGIYFKKPERKATGDKAPRKATGGAAPRKPTAENLPIRPSDS